MMPGFFRCLGVVAPKLLRSSRCSFVVHPFMCVAIGVRIDVILASGVPWVDDRNVESLEMARMARRYRGTTRLRDAGDQRIAQVDDPTGPLAIGSELCCGRRGHLV